MENGLSRKSMFSWTALSLFIFTFLSPLEGFLGGQAGSILKYYAIACIGAFFLFLIYKHEIIIISLFDAFIVLFLLIILVSLLWSRSIDRGNYYINAIGLQIIFILFARRLTFDETQLKLIILGFIIGSVILCIILQFNLTTVGSYTNRFSIAYEDSTIDPNNIAAIIVCGFACLINIHAKNIVLQLLRYVSLILMLLSVVQTGSRGGILAALVVVVYNIFVQKKVTQSLKWIASVILLVLVLIWIDSLFQLHVIEALMERFTDKTGSGRSYIWESAIEAISKQPFFGYGIGSSAEIISSYTGYSIGSHNTYLTILMDAGFFGLLPFVLSIVCLLNFKRKDSLSYCVKGALLAALASGFFIDIYNKKILWIPILLCALISKKERKRS